MNSPQSKTFDCVEAMRQIRARLSREIENLTYEELSRWLRSHRYEEPLLQRLAEKAAQHADAAERSLPQR
jgi:hypothetical protein